MARLLCAFVVIAHFGSAHAEIVDHSFPGGIGAIWGSSPFEIQVLASDGIVYHLSTDSGQFAWVPSRWPLPVNVGEIADWRPETFTTQSGEVWILDQGQCGADAWHLVGGDDGCFPQFPWADVVPGRASGIGKLKSMFR